MDTHKSNNALDNKFTFYIPPPPKLLTDFFSQVHLFPFAFHMLVNISPANKHINIDWTHRHISLELRPSVLSANVKTHQSQH